jgi:3-hydroxyacyl-[acyl-carrier-protein] dehydratase
LLFIDRKPIREDMTETKTLSKNDIDTVGIMDRIPHRYPMLLVDKIVDIVRGESCTGIKNVTANEPFFQGHFPGHPIMPGVLIIEAMAQTAGVLVIDSLDNFKANSYLVYFMSIEDARFRKPVVPGDRLEMKVRKERQRGMVWKFRGEAFVDGVLCAEAVYTAMLIPQDQMQDGARGQ